MIIAGDFNATLQNADFRRLLGHGLFDAHYKDGGWSPTWPRTWWWLPPVLRIDHVLVTRSIGVQRQQVLGNSDSDHSALLTDVTIA